MHRKKLPHLVTSLLILSSALSNAAATRIAFIDSFATARGNAFTATADNPSAVFYNAAGLTQLEGTQVHGNVFAISLGYEFEGNLVGDTDMEDDFQAVPSFFVSHTFSDAPIAIGFGAYAPFALSSDWGSDAAFAAPFPSPISAVPYEANLEYVKYHLVLAWAVNEQLSLAAGVSYDETDIELKANAVEFDGNDQVFGYSFSILWQASEKHNFGLNYQAKTTAKYDGKATGGLISAQTLGSTDTIDSGAKVMYPESIVFGYSYRPNEKWNIEFNLDWTNWDRVNELSLNGVAALPYELNWESAYIAEFGATRYFDNGWYLSGGYTFVENAIPDEDLLPIVPDSDRHFFALGVGRSYDHLSWHFTYQQAFASERSVKGNTFPTVDGNYDLDSQAVSFSLNYRF